MPEGRPPQNAAVLVGNGLSISVNEKLNLAAITREMIARIEAATDNGDKVVHAMKVIARRATTDGEVTEDDFEKLVGAFDSQALTLEEVGKLAGLVAANDTVLNSAIREVTAFSQRVRDMGMSYVLQVIMENSVGDWNSQARLHSLVSAIVEEFDGNVYFGNLNYDTLLLSSLMAVRAPLADMGRGHTSISLRVIDEEDPDADAPTYTAQVLRRINDFPPGSRYRVKLLHLHGSLTYWQRTTGIAHIKVKVDVLRQHDLWSGLRDGNPKWRPSVVLANQQDKARHVERQPFKLAYEVFQAGLKESDSWIVIGYSFRDACVNDMLRREFLSRSPKPRVLVSTYGEELTREGIERAFGWGREDGASHHWLSIDREGAMALQNSWSWEVFTMDDSKVEGDVAEPVGSPYAGAHAFSS
jgi:hypothetical protein